MQFTDTQIFSRKRQQVNTIGWPVTFQLKSPVIIYSISITHTRAFITTSGKGTKSFLTKERPIHKTGRRGALLRASLPRSRGVKARTRRRERKRWRNKWEEGRTGRVAPFYCRALPLVTNARPNRKKTSGTCALTDGANSSHERRIDVFFSSRR